jgi:hypothetical protein
MVLAHGHRSRRTLVAGWSITEAYVEAHRVETGREDDEMAARLRDATLGELDERCANSVASGRGRDVQAFDGVEKTKCIWTLSKRCDATNAGKLFFGKTS